MMTPKRETKTESEGPKRFDFSSTIEKLQESLKKEKGAERRVRQFGLGDTLPPISTDPKDYIIMPDWWKEHIGVPGLQFGKIVEIAGDSDTGKTSLALEAILRAQQQGVGVIYVETEGKTTEQDFIGRGIDPKGVMLVHSSITEEAFDGALRIWTRFFEDYPDERLLLVYDSYGNTVSQRDAAIDMTQKDQKPGEAAKTNRQGLNTMIARMLMGDKVAVLIVNYTYANMKPGAKGGQIMAGGKALYFFSMLILQSTRISWIEAQRDKKKVRLGARVRWRIFKNHYAKALVDEKGQQILLPSYVDLSITAEGFCVLGKGGIEGEIEEGGDE